MTRLHMHYDAHARGLGVVYDYPNNANSGWRHVDNEGLWANGGFPLAKQKCTKKNNRLGIMGILALLPTQTRDA